MLRVIDDLLRGRRGFAAGRATFRWAHLVGLLLAGGLIYGSVMGSFGARVGQSLYSAVKVPLLIGASTVIALPTFFVANALIGLRADFDQAVRAVVTAQGAVSLALTSLAPLVAFAYTSGVSYNAAIVLNGGCFLLAALGGQALLSGDVPRLVESV